MFFAAFNFKGASLHLQESPEVIKKRLNPFTTPDQWGHFRNNNVLMVQSTTWNTASSKQEPAPYTDNESGITVVSWARIDNKEDLYELLALNKDQGQVMCDSRFIALAYLKWGEGCVSRLIGDFAFVIHDSKKKRFFCGRDHMGVRPFYYYLSDQAFVCSTNLAALTESWGAPVYIEEEWIVEYLCGLSTSFDGTPYKDIKKLPPANSLIVSADQQVLRQYFDLNEIEPLKLNDSREYVDAYREQLEEAVKCRVVSDYPIGCELSGGLDSTTIASFAARELKGRLSNFHTFSSCYRMEEPQHIMAVGLAFNLPNTHIVSGHEYDMPEEMKRSLRILGYPFENANALAHEPFYRMAEKFNVRTLLSGFGGDEFSTSIHGNMVPKEMVMQGRYKELFQILEGNPFMRALRALNLLRRKIATNNFKKEVNQLFHQAFQGQWLHLILKQEKLAEYGIEERLLHEAKFDSGYTDLKKFTLEKRWMPSVPTRMENCLLTSAAKNIEYRWPLLDVRLVKLFLSIPSEENFYRGMGRYLHRRAIDGIVPDLVAWKRRKGMGAFAPSSSPLPEEINQSTDKGLHPDLESLLDVRKYRQQIETLKKNNGKGPGVSGFNLRLNINRISLLNQWLWKMSS